tara:strand:- start:2006 stop:4828 length:2823 start_codon:yes stop_codon:yes gene_type:complete
LKNKANLNTGSENFSIEMNRDRTALVIDADVVSSQAICEMLNIKGYEAMTCDSIREARESFSSQSLIVLSLHGDDPEIQSFIEDVSNRSGKYQKPYLFALNHKNISKIIEGIDQVLAVPIDEKDFLLRLEDAGAVIAERSQKVTGNWNSRNRIHEQAIPQKSHDGTDRVGEEAPIIVRRGTGEADFQNGSGSLPGNNLRSMVDACPLAMAMFDRNMNYLFSNGSWNDSIGSAVLDSSGVGQFEFIPRVSNEWRSLCNDCFKYGTEQVGEELVQWSSGEKEWIRWFVNPWYLEDVALGGLVISAQSINVEKTLDIERRFEADVAESVMTSPLIPVLFLDLKGRVVRSNRAAKQLAHWDPILDEGKYYWEIFLQKSEHDASREQYLMFSQKLMNGGQFTYPDTTVDQITDNEGSQRSVIWSNSPRRSSDGSVIGIIRVGTDAGLFSNHSESNISDSDLLERCPVPAWTCDDEGSVDSVNDAWISFRGCAKSGDMDLMFYEGMESSDVQKLSNLIRSSVTSRLSFSEIFKVKDSNGKERNMRFCVDPDKDNAEKTVYGLAYDVTAELELSMIKSQSARFEADLVASGVELKRAKKEIADLKSSSARVGSIPELLPSGIVLLGRDGKIIYTNDAASQIVGTDLASFEMIEDWLSHALIANDQLGVNELLERWRSLVWVKGSAGVFPISTDSKEPLQIEVRPKLMNDGGLLVALSEVTGLKSSDKLVRDNKESLSEMNRRMDVLLSIVSDILRLWGNDQNTETLSVTVSRIDALALLLTHTTGEEHFSSVNFGQYTSSLVKELIELAPNCSDPCVHLNYGVQRGVDSLGRAPRIERKEIFMPYSLAMPLALICNEILRNIFIHACQDRDEVTVKFSIIINDDGSSGELLFSHDGVPLPADYDLDRDAGNGLKIVRSLVRRIGGELKMNCGLMTEFHVGFCFPEGR